MKRSAKKGVMAARKEKIQSSDEVLGSHLEDAKLDPLTHPGHLVRRLHQICVSVFLSRADEFGLTHIQFAALKAIEYAPGLDQTTLGRLIAIDRQNTSNVVNRLSERGWINRQQRDKRTYSLYLTAEGVGVIEAMKKYVPEIDDTILKPLNEKEREIFMVLLEKLVNVNNELSRAPQIL